MLFTHKTTALSTLVLLLSNVAFSLAMQQDDTMHKQLLEVQRRKFHRLWHPHVMHATSFLNSQSKETKNKYFDGVLQADIASKQLKLINKTNSHLCDLAVLWKRFYQITPRVNLWEYVALLKSEIEAFDTDVITSRHICFWVLDWRRAYGGLISFFANSLVPVSSNHSVDGLFKIGRAWEKKAEQQVTQTVIGSCCSKTFGIGIICDSCKKKIQQAGSKKVTGLMEILRAWQVRPPEAATKK